MEAEAEEVINLRMVLHYMDKTDLVAAGAAGAGITEIGQEVLVVRRDIPEGQAGWQGLHTTVVAAEAAAQAKMADTVPMSIIKMVATV